MKDNLKHVFAKSIFFLMLIINTMYSMKIANEELQVSTASLDTIAKDSILLIGMQLLKSSLQYCEYGDQKLNDNVELQLTKWAYYYSPIKFFTYVNVIINYAEKYPRFDYSEYEKKGHIIVKSTFRTPFELFLSITVHKKQDIDIFQCLNIERKQSIMNKITANQFLMSGSDYALTYKEAAFIKPFLKKEMEIQDEEKRNTIFLEYICVMRPLSKKVKYCFFSFIEFQFLSILFYIPVVIGSVLGTSVLLVILERPIKYLFGDSFIEKHFGSIVHIGPAIYYLALLYELMERTYKEEDRVNII